MVAFDGALSGSVTVRLVISVAAEKKGLQTAWMGHGVESGGNSMGGGYDDVCTSIAGRYAWPMLDRRGDDRWSLSRRRGESGSERA